MTAGSVSTTRITSAHEPGISHQAEKQDAGAMSNAAETLTQGLRDLPNEVLRHVCLSQGPVAMDMKHALRLVCQALREGLSIADAKKFKLLPFRDDAQTSNTDEDGKLTQAQLSRINSFELTITTVIQNRNLQSLELRLDEGNKDEGIYGMCTALTNAFKSQSPLANLEHLNLNYSEITSAQLTEIITKTPKLKTLNLEGCDEIEALPENITQLTQLESLNTNYCPIKTLPSNLSVLTKLQHLKAPNCTITSLPNRLKHLELGTLDSENCSALTQAFENKLLLENLEHLDLSDSDINPAQLKTIIKKIPNLKTLNLTDCNEIDTLPENITNLSQLESLNVSNCPIKTLPTNLGNLPKLQELNLMLGISGEWVNLPNSMLSLTGLTSLTSLTLGTGVIELEGDAAGAIDENFSNMVASLLKTKPNLHTLALYMLDNEYTEALSKQGTSQPNPFANLRTLELGGLNLTDTQTCSKLLEAMPNLEVLTITDTGLTTLPSNISTKTNLRELNLIGRNSKLTVPEDLHNKADLVIYRKNLECHNQA